MRKVLKLIYVILIILFAILIIRYLVNENYISKYNDGEYEKTDFSKLTILNINEPYITYYNEGNFLYKNNEFDDAIDLYEKALESYPSQEDECSIRINLALAKLAKIEDDYDSEENKDKTLQILADAKNVLLEKDCATEDDDGHSEEAEELKEDIEELEDELKNEEEEEENKKDPSKKDDSDEEDDNNNGGSSAEQKIKEKKKQTYENRIEGMEAVNSIIDNDGSGYDYYDGKTW